MLYHWKSQWGVHIGFWSMWMKGWYHTLVWRSFCRWYVSRMNLGCGEVPTCSGVLKWIKSTLPWIFKIMKYFAPMCRYTCPWSLCRNSQVMQSVWHWFGYIVYLCIFPLQSLCLYLETPPCVAEFRFNNVIFHLIGQFSYVTIRTSSIPYFSEILSGVVHISML